MVFQIQRYLRVKMWYTWTYCAMSRGYLGIASSRREQCLTPAVLEWEPGRSPLLSPLLLPV
jgi:hypothetical protein